MLFADDIDLDLYALIRATSVDNVYRYARAREAIYSARVDLEEEAAINAPTEAPCSDTVPISFEAPTSRPARLAG